MYIHTINTHCIYTHIYIQISKICCAHTPYLIYAIIYGVCAQYMYCMHSIYITYGEYAQYILLYICIIDHACPLHQHLLNE